MSRRGYVVAAVTAGLAVRSSRPRPRPRPRPRRRGSALLLRQRRQRHRRRLDPGADQRPVARGPPDRGGCIKRTCLLRLAGHAYAKSKLSGRWVTLRTDAKHDLSDGSRLFAYVYVQGSLFNIKEIRGGYAKERWYGPTYRLRSEFKAAERKAKAEHVGLWGHC